MYYSLNKFMNICLTGMKFKIALSYNILLRSVNVLILFLSNLVFVRIAGAGITGDFFYLITILSFITLLVSFSMETGITYFVSKNISSTVSFAWFIIIISILQLIASFIIISAGVNNQTALSVQLLVLFVISNILVSNFTALYVSLKWFVQVNVIILSVNLIALVLLLIVYRLYDSSAIIKAQKIYVLSFCIQALVLILFFLLKSRGKWQIPSGAILKKVLKYSLLALAGNISFFLVTRLDYVFVKAFCTSQALGNYIQVSKIGQMFVLIPTMAATVIFPFAAIDSENIFAKVQWLCRLMSISILLASLSIIFTGKWLLPWFFGKDFNLMYPAVLFYLPAIFSLCISSLLASYISGKGFMYINVIASCIALVIVITGDVIFIPKYGINAAAAICSIAYTACMLFLIRHCLKKYHSKMADFFSISFNELKYLVVQFTDKNKI